MKIRLLATLFGLFSVSLCACGGADEGGSGSTPNGGTGGGTSGSCLSLSNMDWVLKPTQPFGEETMISDLSVDATSVYFSTNQSVGKMPLTGAAAGTPTQLYTTSTTTVWTHHILDADRLLVSADGGKFLSVPVAGGTPTELANFPYTVESTLAGISGAVLSNGVLYGRNADYRTSPSTYTYFSYALATGTSKVLATTTLTGGAQFAVSGDYVVTKDIQGSAVGGNQTHTLYHLPVAGGELQKLILTPAPFPNVYVIGAAGKAAYILSVPNDQVAQKAQVIRTTSEGGAWETVLTMTALAYPRVFLLATANSATYLNVADKIYSLPATGAGKQVACFDYVGYTTQGFTVDGQYAYMAIYQSGSKTNGIARVRLP